MADAGAVRMTRNSEGIGNALLKIANFNLDKCSFYYKATHRECHNQSDYLRKNSYLFGSKRQIIEHKSKFFDTHPSLEERMVAMGFQASDVRARVNIEKYEQRKKNNRKLIYTIVFVMVLIMVLFG